MTTLVKNKQTGRFTGFPAKLPSGIPPTNIKKADPPTLTPIATPSSSLKRPPSKIPTPSAKKPKPPPSAIEESFDWKTIQEPELNYAPGSQHLTPEQIQQLRACGYPIDNYKLSVAKTSSGQHMGKTCLFINDVFATHLESINKKESWKMQAFAKGPKNPAAPGTGIQDKLDQIIAENKAFHLQTNVNLDHIWVKLAELSEMLGNIQTLVTVSRPHVSDSDEDEPSTEVEPTEENL